MPIPNIRLLIIDDEDDVLQVLKETAVSQGFDVSLALSVDEALGLLNAGLEVDCVLCDVTMPDGGAEHWLTQCASAYPALASRTIVITGWNATSETGAVAAIGPDRCLFKPFSMSDVRRVVDQLLSSS